MKEVLMCFLIFTSWFVTGQNKQLLYNFEDLPQSLLINPGAEPTFDFHVGIPLSSQVHLSAGSSGVTLYDIFKAGDTTSFNQRLRNSLATMNEKDFVTFHQQLELLSVGWRGKSGVYYSAGIYQEADGIGYVPRDLAIIALEGNSGGAHRRVNFSQIAFTAELLNVFHFGITKQHSRRFSYGVRGKLYSSALNIRSVGNEGEFRSEPIEGHDKYLPLVNNVEAAVQTAGLVSLEGAAEGIDHTIGGLFLGGNLGLGVDVGFTYHLNGQWRVTGSLLDLGIIAYLKDVETTTYYADSDAGELYLDYNAPEENPIDNLGALTGDLEDYYFEIEDQEAYYSMRPLKFNATLDYGWGYEVQPCGYMRNSKRTRYHHYAGLQLFSVLRPKGLVNAATLFYDGKLFDGLRGKATYTVDSFSYHNIGLLLSARLRSFNVYLGGDNLFSHSNLATSHGASVQFGAQFIFN